MEELEERRLERPTVVWLVGMEREANRAGMSGVCMAVCGGGDDNMWLI